MVSMRAASRLQIDGRPTLLTTNLCRFGRQWPPPKLLRSILRLPGTFQATTQVASKSDWSFLQRPSEENLEQSRRVWSVMVDASRKGLWLSTPWVPKYFVGPDSVFDIPRGRPANQVLETRRLILNGAGLRGSRHEANGLMPKRQWTPLIGFVEKETTTLLPLLLVHKGRSRLRRGRRH